MIKLFEEYNNDYVGRKICQKQQQHKHSVKRKQTLSKHTTKAISRSFNLKFNSLSFLRMGIINKRKLPSIKSIHRVLSMTRVLAPKMTQGTAVRL